MNTEDPPDPSAFIEVFRNFLNDKGLRMTRERSAVISVVFGMRSPFSASDLYSTCKIDHRVSRATVYRTIAYLEESGLIERDERDDGEALYRHPLMVEPSENELIYGSLCDEAHQRMITGRCPWCGRDISNYDTKTDDAT